MHIAHQFPINWIPQPCSKSTHLLLHQNLPVDFYHQWMRIRDDVRVYGSLDVAANSYCPFGFTTHTTGDAHSIGIVAESTGSNASFVNNRSISCSIPFWIANGIGCGGNTFGVAFYLICEQLLDVPLSYNFVRRIPLGSRVNSVRHCLGRECIFCAPTVCSR